MNDATCLKSLLDARWIYFKEEAQEDEYSEYKVSFRSPKCQKGTLLIGCDSDVQVLLNGKLVYFGASPSYPDHPIFDKVEVELQEGENEAFLTLYYFGSADFSSYCKGKAGLIFAFLSEEGETLCRSGEGVLSRLCPTYRSHRKKAISPQLGYSYAYDFKGRGKEGGWSSSCLLRREGQGEFRINERCLFLSRPSYEWTRVGKGHYLLDFRKETVGHLDVDFNSPVPQRILVCYAEHRNEDLSLPYRIENRDFSVELFAQKGRNVFLDTFRRLGFRYLEIFAEEDLEISYFGVTEIAYPFRVKERKLKDPLLQKIHDVCVYTLSCCYHSHYEDCPWREQCLYAMDSYNQAISGFVCFENLEQLKSSLLLISQDERKDRLLSICSPSQSYLTIPSFSLFYFKSVALYGRKSGDVEFLKRVYPKLKSILSSFEERIEDGLLYTFDAPGTWNFYEWASGLEGGLNQKQFKRADILLNSLFLWALDGFESIEDQLGIPHDSGAFRQRNRERIRETLLKDGAFLFSQEDPFLSQYANSCAVLMGYFTPEEARNLETRLKTSEGMVPCTLSSKPFLYDALLKIDPKNASWVIEDIKKTHGKMLESGATTFYETELGAEDFNGAGSLCHGWSSYPLAFFEKLGLYL